MRRLHLVLGAVALMSAGCADDSPPPLKPSPVPQITLSQPPAAPGPCAIGFDELIVNGAAFVTHSACGLYLTATPAAWQVSTTYGHPAPFVQFISPAGATTTGEISITAAGATFGFVSVDFYSSTTTIPYEITGFAGQATVFTVLDVQGNTFGNFATIGNPAAPAPVDRVRIRLTNVAARCCSNPMGLDNIRVIR